MTKNYLISFFLLVAAARAVSQIPLYAPTENLVAWYNLDASAADASGNGNHGAAFNTEATVNRIGQPNGAYYFDGASSEVSIPYSPAFNAYPFSVSLWCLPAEDSNGGTLINQYSNASWNGWLLGMSGTGGPSQTVSPGYMLAAPPNCNGVVSSAQCATGINYTGNLFDNQWHMLTFTIDADSGRLYVDGVWQTSQAWTGPASAPTNADNLRIAGTDLGDLFFFHGSIDEVGIWNRALQPTEIEQLYFGLPPTVGCTNTNACNYLPTATTDDGSCIFDCAGCLDPCACNYNQNAAFNDGSCDYSCNQAMSFITVFHDANGNGWFDNNERPLQYWPVKIEELEKTVYTDAMGLIVVPLPAGLFHIQLLESSSAWAPTTPSQAEVWVPGNTQVFFGLQPMSTEAAVEVDELVGYAPFAHCENGMESGLYVRNTGAQVLHGQLTLTCDAQFVPEAPFSSNMAPNTTGAGYAQWNLEALQPWETRLLAFQLAGPGSDWQGQTIYYSLQLELFDESGNMVWSQLVSSEKIVSCEQQPMRLQTEPEGYNEAFRYVPSGASMTFRSQFQNTTSEWAEDVLLIHNLNSQQFDLASFELLYASEAVVGCLHDDGTLDLEFSNLVAAPVDEDPAQSGAYAVYRVRLRDDIPPDSTFYHTTHSVFDLNTTIGSDTVFHTIYDCSWLGHVTGVASYCEGDTIDLRAEEIWIDQYSWLLGDSIIGTDAELRILLAAGFYNVVSRFTNPVCDVCEHNPIEVHALPTGEIWMQGDTLYSQSDAYCQWFLDGSPIDNGTQSFQPIETSGVYRALWTAASGCESWSEEWMVSGVDEFENNLMLYPNPAHTEVHVWVTRPCDVTVSTLEGRMVSVLRAMPGTSSIDVSSWAPGLYRIQLNGNDQSVVRLLVVQ